MFSDNWEKTVFGWVCNYTSSQATAINTALGLIIDQCNMKSNMSKASSVWKPCLGSGWYWWCHSLILPIEKSESTNWIFNSLKNRRARTEFVTRWKIWERKLNFHQLKNLSENWICYPLKNLRSKTDFLPVEKSDSENWICYPLKNLRSKNEFSTRWKLNLPDGGKLLPRSTESTDQRLKTLPPWPGLPGLILPKASLR